MVNGAQIAEWLSRLVAVPSVNLAHIGPSSREPGEEALATTLVGWFESLGAEVQREDVAPGRPNLYAIWRGRSDRWAGLDVHIDTVGVEQMPGDPFARRIENGRVYGRGAVDTKASLGIALALIEAARQAGRTPEVNLLITTTADEEDQQLGASAFAVWLRRQPFKLDTLMVAEPTLCTPVYAHKGASRLEFTVHGKATHSAQPHLGKNAITAAAHAIVALEAEHHRLQSVPPQTALGHPTLTTTLIHGGIGLNVVPEACRFSVDRRVVAGESVTEVTAGMKAIVEQTSPLPVSTRILREMDAFFNAPDTPWLRQLAEWSGQTPSVAPYGTNAFAYGGLAHEAVVMGPGSIDQAHGAEEWVDLAELEKMAGVYARWWGL